MVCSLRYAMGKIIGKDKSYLHYYKSMIKAYEKEIWEFDIRDIVKKIKVEIPCPKYVCRKGFTKRLCLTVLDDKLFETQLSKYMSEIIVPLHAIRKDRILARIVWIEMYGAITKPTMDCIRAGYKCENCPSKDTCKIIVRYTKNSPAVAKMARMFELLYGNFKGASYWEKLVS